MAKRSLQASPPGIQQAKRSFSLKGWTQENLAAEVNLKTRQPIWRFFTGQPVDRQIFMEICTILDLEWREVATNPPAEFPEPGRIPEISDFDINNLVSQIRTQRQDAIQYQCGVLQLIDINHPVSLDDIYVDVNILKEIPSQTQLKISEFQSLRSADLNRIDLGVAIQKGVPGVEAVTAHRKLIVLGKPGVGKTTFLKHLAIQCSKGQFSPDHVPVFITLREFAAESRLNSEMTLMSYIQQSFVYSGVTQSLALETLLQSGRVLLLLDGLDEIPSQDNSLMLREIRKFTDLYHRNMFVLSCRTASKKFRLGGFTDVEIADFTQEQITIFSKKWFVALTEGSVEFAEGQANQFIQKLDLPENWQFRQLVATPLFLHLACWVFQGQGQFPIKRADFYRRGLDLLLGTWDESKGVERESPYRDFLLPQKLKMLSQLAAVTFENAEFFFEQETIEHYICLYLQDLETQPQDPEELQVKSQAILRSVEAQHGLLIERARGIYSFSTLVFLEYLTARKIVANHNLRGLERPLGDLVSHIGDPHWREIIMLTASMLHSADSLVLLMKQQIDEFVVDDPYLQEFLVWASQKSKTIPPMPKLATTRAFYLSLAKTPHRLINFALANTLEQGILLDAAMEHLLTTVNTDPRPDFAYIEECAKEITSIMVMVGDPSLYKSLQILRDRLPPTVQTKDQLNHWWEMHYQQWAAALRNAIGQHRDINHAWKFSPEQEQSLQYYYNANQLLVDCLNSTCDVTPAIRQEIEATLLLPQQEMEDREWEGS
jgi:predicted NACHT family NTPase